MVLLRLPDPPEDTWRNGILIPAKVVEENPVAKVIAVGPDIDLDTAGFKIDDVVVVEGQNAHIIDSEHMLVPVKFIGAVANL